MQDVGFDYGLTPRQAGDALIAGAQVLWEREIIFNIGKTESADQASGTAALEG